jgi:hypothetical protein
MRWALALTIVLLAGCQGPPKAATVGVDSYLVSDDHDIRHKWGDGSVHAVTCTGEKHVHLLYVRGGMAWPDRDGWRVHTADDDVIAVEVDEWPDMLGVYACLPPGALATSVSYEEGHDVLAAGVVDVTPRAI